MIFETPAIGPPEEAALQRIEALRRQLRFYVAEPRRWVGSVRRVLSARAIQGSNSIEGHKVSVEDAVAAVEGEDPADARSEDWQAVVGYRRAMTYVLQLAQDPHFEYTSALLRSLHFMMMEHSLSGASPGLWRPGAIWVRNDTSGDIVHEGPDAEDVPLLIDELVTQLSVEHGTPALVRAAMAHLNLVMIHPFRDGNGRMARCLQTLVLARDKILVPEFSSIEEYLGRNTGAYYAILEKVGERKWTPQGDATKWIRFSLTAHYIQATSVLRRVRESEQIWTSIEQLVSQSSQRVPTRALAALFDAATGLRIRNTGYRAILRSWGEEVSNQVASLDLRIMVQAGLLEQRGKKRGTYYVAAGPLVEIRTSVRSGRTPIDATELFNP